MRFSALVFTVASGLIMAKTCPATIVMEKWKNDSLSSSSGTVEIAADGSSSVSKTLTNTTTTESVNVTFSASTGTFRDSSSEQRVGVDAAGNGDDANRIDGQVGTAEFVTFLFDKAITITSLNLQDINWDLNGAGDANDDYEFALVSIGGTLTHTLFSEDAVTTHAGFTGATGPIKATGSDDFTGLSWSIPASTLLKFQFGADAASFTGQDGFSIDNIAFTVAAVPEASALHFGGMICGVGGIAYGARALRRRTAVSAA